MRIEDQPHDRPAVGDLHSKGLAALGKLFQTIKERFGPREIGLFIFDADANVRRDIDRYADRFADGCWMVIDDYISATNKAGPTRTQVDELIAAGRLRTLGFYGWGTWIGRWLLPLAMIFLSVQTLWQEALMASI